MFAELVDKIKALAVAGEYPKRIQGRPGAGEVFMLATGEIKVVPDQPWFGVFRFNSLQSLCSAICEPMGLLGFPDFPEWPKDPNPIQVFVNRYSVDVNFRPNHPTVCLGKLEFTPTQSLQSFWRLQSWVDQEKLFEELNLYHRDSVPDLLDSVQKIHLTRKEETGAEIGIFGTKTETGKAVTLTFPSRKDGSTQEVSIKTDYTLTIQPHYQTEAVWEFPVRLLIDTKNGLKFCLKCPDMDLEMERFTNSIFQMLVDKLAGMAKPDNPRPIGYKVFRGTDESIFGPVDTATFDD